MKKTLTVFSCIVLAICIFSLAAAEDFELRDGIHLYDPVDTVIRLDTIPVEKSKNNSEIYGGPKYQGSGSVEFDNNTQISFYFDKDNKLREMTYDFSAGMIDGPFGFAKYEDASRCFGMFADYFINKYGNRLQPCGTENTAGSAKETYKLATLNNFIQNVPKEMSSWIVQGDTYDVKIEIYLCNSKDSWNDADTYRVLAGFVPITKNGTLKEKNGNTGNVEGTSGAIDEAIAAIMDNIKGDEIKNPDGKPNDFRQKVEYDKDSNTFIHYIVNPAFILPGYALNLDLDPSTVSSWQELWKTYRQMAELWILEDAADVMNTVKDAEIIMKFVSTLDVNSEDYLEIYSLKEKDLKIKILTNVLTDDYKPVISQELFE